MLPVHRSGLQDWWSMQLFFNASIIVYPSIFLSHIPQDIPSAHLSLIPSGHSSLKQLGEVRCAETRNRVPSRSSVPASIRDNRAAVGLAVEAGMAIASSAATKNDVVERIGVGVQQGVQETKSGLLGS